MSDTEERSTNTTIRRLPTPGGGKRRSVAPLATTSDESEDETLKIPNIKNEETDSAVEDDVITSPLSPSGSSTASGPIYVRPPGFKHHAQEIISRPRIKKKKKIVILRDGLKKHDAIAPKIKPKRDPVPMRLRALPQSFWQQPNKPQPYSPAGVYPILPPLYKGESNEDESEIRPVTPPEENNNGPREDKKSPTSSTSSKPERKITVTNADLLLKLFDGIEDESKDRIKKQSKDSLLRRNRAKRLTPSSNHRMSHQKIISKTPIALIADEDPFMVEAVTESLFPQLSLEHSKQYSQLNGNSSLHLVTLKEGDRSVTLPSLSIEQNYSQMLSELVMHI